MSRIAVFTSASGRPAQKITAAAGEGLLAEEVLDVILLAGESEEADIGGVAHQNNNRAKGDAAKCFRIIMLNPPCEEAVMSLGSMGQTRLYLSVFG